MQTCRAFVSIHETTHSVHIVMSHCVPIHLGTCQELIRNAACGILPVDACMALSRTDQQNWMADARSLLPLE